MPEPGNADLKQTPVFNQAVFKVLPMGLAVLDADGEVVFANEAWLRLARESGRTGYERGANYLAARQRAAMTGDGIAQKETDAVRAVQQGATKRSELNYPSLPPSGPQWYSLRVMPLEDDSGGVVILLENITAQRQLEVAGNRLPSGGSHLAHLAHLAVDQVDEGFFWADASGRIVDANQTAFRQTGYSREEILELSVPALCPDLTAAAWPGHWRELQRRANFSMESRCRNKAGTVYPVEIFFNYIADGGRELAFIVIRNITEYKLVEEEMFRSNEMLRAILDSIPVRVYWKDLNLVYQGCNQSFAKDAGCKSPGEVAGMTDFDTPWKDRAELYRADDMAVIRTRAPKLNYEEFITGPAGDFVWLKVSKVPLFDADGQVSGVLGTYEDITERKQFDKLMQQQTRWSAFEAEVGLALSENLPLPVILQRSAEAVVRHLGAALTRIWLFDPEQTVLELKASAGLSAALDDKYSRVPVGPLGIGVVVLRGRTFYANDLESSQLVDPEWVKRENLVAFAGYPLTVEDRVEGVLGLFSRQKLSDHTLKVLGTVVRAIAQVTGRHRAELALRQSEARLSTFFRACPVGISISRPVDGSCVEVNDILVEMFGFSRGEMLSHTSLELGLWVDPADRAEWIRQLKQHGRVQQYKARFRRKSGVIGTMLVAAELIELEGEQHVLGIFTDVTASEQKNEELRRAKEAADVANRAKSTFLANMSHDIRTPMNAILGYAQLMQRDPAMPADAREKLNIINRSGQHLLALIEDVLEMSKIEAGRVSVQPVCFHLRGMLGDLTAMFRLRADAKGLEFKVTGDNDLPAQVVADEGKLRQVLVNLLGNAVKFTARGRIELQLEARRREDRQLWLGARVTDTGVGMSAEALAKLFRQFEYPGGVKFNEGTGLGLSISREYARLMGGDITVTSQEGQGSSFHLEIPVREGDYQPTAMPAGGRRVIGMKPGQPPVLVLLADDNAPNRNWLKQLLTLIGCQVIEAANGEDAIRVWEQWKPQLILMDLQMPLLDGFEATRRIKALPAGRDTVILALTATVLEESRRAILAAGAADLLGKPMEESMLFEKMQSRLGIEFIYESAAAAAPVNEEPVSPERRAQSVAGLPAALRAAMRDAIANGDLEGFQSRLQEAGQIDPAVVRYLQPLAEQYDYDNLLQLLT